MSNKHHYRVRWEIDVWADSPRDAAILAMELHANPHGIAHHYVARALPNGTWVNIDLDEEPPESGFGHSIVTSPEYQEGQRARNASALKAVGEALADRAAVLSVLPEPELAKREHTTILAALRYVQSLSPQVRFDIFAQFADENIAPLDNAEIDTVCERIENQP